MELSLLEKEKKTRIKISQKEWRTDKVLQAMMEVFVDKKILTQMQDFEKRFEIKYIN